MTNISPTHPLIRYIGRVDFQNTAGPSYSYPAVAVRIRFTGTRLHVLLDDNAIKQSEATTNYFNIIVDGNAPHILTTHPDQKEYVLAEKLARGIHEVEFFKRSESSHGEDLNVGKITIRGFRIEEDATLYPTTEHAIKMEFIGDSITCGYGNELSVENPINNHFTTANSNAYNSFGAIAARMLDAEYVAVAYSGRGVVRNYGGDPSETLPDVYPRIMPDDPSQTPWDPAAYIPDIVVINLGTNDFSEGIHDLSELETLERQYTERYFVFLSELLAQYPNAQFVLAIGPMLNDSFPPEYNALSRVRRSLQTIRTKTSTADRRRVHILEFSQQKAPYGEDFHPTVATHQEMANILVQFINEKTGLKQSGPIF